MKKKSNKSKLVFIFCICFIFILINSTIVLNIGNTYQVVFSQGYIPPPPSSNIQSKSIQQCAQIGIIGPTYTGLDGCPKPCPTTSNNPNVANVYIPPECRNQAIGNQSGDGQYSEDNPCVSAQVYIGPTYRDQEFGCPIPCPTSGNIPTGCPINPIGKGGGIQIGNQSGQTQTNTPSGSCPTGVQTFAACNFGNSQGPVNSDDNATNKGNANP
jgi:hypothetical protein